MCEAVRAPGRRWPADADALASGKWTWWCQSPTPKFVAKKAGFNQAELLSKRAAKLKRTQPGLLLGQKATSPGQAFVNERERWVAVRGAFATPPGSQVDNKRVLLVNDVMMTGATLDAYAKALRDAGASGAPASQARAVVRNPQRVDG